MEQFKQDTEQSDYRIDIDNIDLADFIDQHEGLGNGLCHDLFLAVRSGDIDRFDKIIEIGQREVFPEIVETQKLPKGYKQTEKTQLVCLSYLFDLFDDNDTSPLFIALEAQDSNLANRILEVLDSNPEHFTNTDFNRKYWCDDKNKELSTLELALELADQINSTANLYPTIEKLSKRF